MPAKRTSVGMAGESVAARFLQRRGVTILDRNVRVGRDEIDLLDHAAHGVDLEDALLGRELHDHGVDAAFPERKVVLVEIDGSSRMFMLEAPTDQWEGVADQLGKIGLQVQIGHPQFGQFAEL